MWYRKDLKKRAKEVLKRNYWYALLISIVIALAGGTNGRGISYHSSTSKSNTYSTIHSNSFINWNFIFIIIIIVITVIIIAMLLRIFVGYCLEIGGRKYFIQSAQYTDTVRCFRYAFNGENYLGIVKTMLVRNIYIFLWSLLLIIPGIIKSYAYRMVPYILADNPNIGVEKAIQLSINMTNGHKLDMFVLDLSFIGWYILGSLAFGIGVIFVMPYENATNAELYLVLRENALDNNFCNYNDLLLN